MKEPIEITAHVCEHKQLNSISDVIKSECDFVGAKDFYFILSKSNICPFMGLSNFADILNGHDKKGLVQLIRFIQKHKGFCEIINVMLEVGFTNQSVIDCLVVCKLSLPSYLKDEPENIILNTTYIMANDLLRLNECESYNYAPEQMIRASIISIFKNIALHIGHTCYPIDDVYKKLAPIFPDFTYAFFENCIQYLVDNRFLVRFNHVGALYHVAKCEADMFAQVKKRNNCTSFPILSKVESTTLDDSQMAAIDMASQYNVSIINGPPGAGKSKVVADIIDLSLQSGLAIDDILLLATISKAAKRISHPKLNAPQTVHMALAVKNSNDLDSIVTGKTPSIHLKKRLVLVDESSFLDLSLFMRLLNSLPINSKVILVGDENQLAPIGFGFVFRDLLQRGIPFTTLTGSYRSVGGIKQCAQSIITDSFTVERKFSDVDMLWTNSDTETLEAIKKYVPKLIVYHSLDYINDVQVLVPTHKNAVGTISLNKAMQKKINPDANSKYRLTHGYFQINDKIMFTKNNYRKGISNGDLGVIFSIENNEDKMTFGIKSQERIYYISEEGMNDVALAYASTIHKFNGCELDTIILAIGHEPLSMLTKNELYSAITRAKKRVLIIGSQKQFNAALTRSSNRFRLTQSFH